MCNDGMSLPRRCALPQVLALIVSVFMGPAIANAQQPTLLELQLESAKLETIVWDRLLDTELCWMLPFPFPPPSGPSTVLDRVVFPTQPLIVKNGPAVQLTVPIDVFLKPESCLSDPNCGATDYTAPAPLSLDIVYTMNINLGTSSLCFGPPSIFLQGTQIPVDPATLPGSLSLALQVGCVPFNIAPILALLPPGSNPTLAGVSALPDGSRIAIRIEFNGPVAGSVASWAAFVGGTLMPIAPPPAMEWSVFVDQQLLQGQVLAQVNGGLATSNQLQLISGPTATWLPVVPWRTPANPGVIVSFVADAINTPCPNDIEIDPVTIEALFQVVPWLPNNIRTRLFTEINPSVGDVITCVAGSLLLGPDVFLVALGVVSEIAANFQPNANQLGLPANCQQVNVGQFVCDQPFQLAPLDVGGPTVGNFTLDQSFGIVDGLVLGGPLDLQGPPPGLGPANPKEPLTVEASEITYGIVGGCNSLSLGYDGFVRIGGDGVFCRPFSLNPSNPPQPPIQIVDDPLGIYDVVWPGAHPKGPNYLGVPGQTAEIVFPANYNVYNTFFDILGAYPLRMVIRTSAGLRFVEIDAPTKAPELGSPERAALEGALALAKINCMHRLLMMPESLAELLWIIDPPPIRVPVDVVFHSKHARHLNPRAILQELRVVVHKETPARALTSDAQYAQFDRVPLGVRGKILVDFGTMGTVTIPVRTQMFRTLKVARLSDHLEAVLTLSEGISFKAEVDAHHLPDGVESLSVGFDLSPDQLQLASKLYIVSVEKEVADRDFVEKR